MVSGLSDASMKTQGSHDHNLAAGEAGQRQSTETNTFGGPRYIPLATSELSHTTVLTDSIPPVSVRSCPLTSCRRAFSNTMRPCSAHR